ncbi:oxygenase MpaB family protein [Mycobacterium sp. 852002-51057_SCH5723018]|uniref:oxygenase MpaB family protein n=1 Tax=Mycobacterium sp. 852002-51057_SCH5723018 TaxID=1834094 RepID=UPI0018D47E0C|nr:oxygenase MpaB family protein [Mycobacterium sp. 852002-51057_SCH5723018]
MGDERADEVVEKVFKRDVNEVNRLMRTLVRNDQPVPTDLPEELRGYVTTSLSLPEWADADKIKKGQEVFEEYGLFITLCLFCASLPSAYADAKAVKVLYLTAQLDTDARRRVMETGQFLLDVCTVGGLDANGKGLRAIQHVRLMHAAVRYLIKDRAGKHPGVWNYSSWGVPINQEDMAATILSFWYVVGDPMRGLGKRLSSKEIDAYLHLWNVIGHLMGVLDDMRPHNAAEANALLDTIKRRRFTASPEGQHMTRALLALLDQLTPTQAFDKTIPPLIRHLIGDQTADLLLVPPLHHRRELEQLARIADWFSTHVLSLVGRATPRYHFVSEIAQNFGRELLETALALERGGVRASFDMPDHLARDWEISKPSRRK